MNLGVPLFVARPIEVWRQAARNYDAWINGYYKLL